MAGERGDAWRETGAGDGERYSMGEGSSSPSASSELVSDSTQRASISCSSPNMHRVAIPKFIVEADGVLTVFRASVDRPGLPIVPPFEVEPPPVLDADSAATEDGLLSCTYCGFMADIAAGAAPGLCPHCGRRHWTAARQALLYKPR